MVAETVVVVVQRTVIMMIVGSISSQKMSYFHFLILTRDVVLRRVSSVILHSISPIRADSTGRSVLSLGSLRLSY